jgi:hypothetical protein
MHYPSSVEVSSDEGKKIARFINKRAMRPLHGER